MCVWTWMPEASTEYCFSGTAHIYPAFWEGSLTGLGVIIRIDALSSKSRLPLSVAVIINGATTPSFLCRCRGWEFRSSCLGASTTPTRLSPQPEKTHWGFQRAMHPEAWSQPDPGAAMIPSSAGGCVCGHTSIDETGKSAQWSPSANKPTNKPFPMPFEDMWLSQQGKALYKQLLWYFPGVLKISFAVLSF